MKDTLSLSNMSVGPIKILGAIQLLDADIDSEESKVNVFVSLQFFWIDNRIVWKQENDADTDINVDQSLIKKIWLPDFYFYDLRSFEKHELFRDFQGGLRLYRTPKNETGLI